MISPAKISILLQQCGLSQREAGILCGVQDRTVRSWLSGRYRIQQINFEILDELAHTIEQNAEKAAFHLNDLISQNENSEVELAICRTDKEAEAKGLPFASCHRAMVLQTLLKLPDEARSRIHLVYAGETPAVNTASYARANKINPE